MNPGFIITPDDIGILQEYLEEFQEADTSLRTRIIEKAMAELYRLRPSNVSFDKKEASKVSSIHILMALSLILHLRKYRSGSITTTLTPNVNMSSLLVNGLPGMPTITSIVMKF